MSSTRSAPPLVIEARASRLLIILLASMHTVAVVMVFASALPFWLTSLCLVILPAHLAYVIRGLPGIPRPGNVRRLTWDSNGTWHIELFDAEPLAGNLLPSSFYHPWLVVLNLSRAGKWRPVSVALFPDALPRETFRQLRVRLKVEGGGLKNS